MSAAKLAVEDDPKAGSTPHVAVDGSTSVIPQGNIDPIYEAKAKILNDAMHEIGFGKYHKALFVVAGFGWLADNVRTQALPRHITAQFPFIVQNIYTHKVARLKLC